MHTHTRTHAHTHTHTHAHTHTHTPHTHHTHTHTHTQQLKQLKENSDHRVSCSFNHSHCTLEFSFLRNTHLQLVSNGFAIKEELGKSLSADCVPECGLSNEPG